ncbi:hypothetical protein DL770_001862 [Monosporascus sp. CRB-9-2]|nr:hypothetical protein DL770_001862 [Monosporascus sp. CRB-9-2]
MDGKNPTNYYSPIDPVYVTVPSSPDSVMEKGSRVPRMPSASEELLRFRQPSLPGASNPPTTAPPEALRAPGQHQAANQIPRTLPRNSPNYRGNLGNAANRCANIPESQSMCLFIVDLPLDCTPAQLLGAVPRGVGKVWSLSISPLTAQHRTAAAKLTFWDRTATDRFLAVVAGGRFAVPGGYRPRVMMNRYRAPSQPTSGASRVLELAGPHAVVNERYLAAFFHRAFRYDVDGVAVLYHSRWYTRLQFRFASCRCQAAFVRRAIERAQHGGPIAGVQLTEDERLLWSKVAVYWGRDPCE